jgi:hypothetical protein
MASRAVGRQTEVNAPLECLVQKFGDIYRVAMTYAYGGDTDRVLHLADSRVRTEGDETGDWDLVESWRVNYE